MDEHDLASVLRDAVELAKRDPDLGFDEVRTHWTAGAGPSFMILFGSGASFLVSVSQVDE